MTAILQQVADSVATIRDEASNAMAQDAAAQATSAYDSIWVNTIPTQAPSALESIMLSHDKLYVVLAVVLIIWIGISIFLVRSDKRLSELERLAENSISDDDL